MVVCDLPRICLLKRLDLIRVQFLMMGASIFPEAMHLPFPKIFNPELPYTIIHTHTHTHTHTHIWNIGDRGRWLFNLGRMEKNWHQISKYI